MWDYIVRCYEGSANFNQDNFNKNYQIGKDTCIKYYTLFENQPNFQIKYKVLTERFELTNDKSEDAQFCVFYSNFFVDWFYSVNKERLAYPLKYIEAVKKRELNKIYSSDYKNASENERIEILNICDRFLFIFSGFYPYFPENTEINTVCNLMEALVDEIKILRKGFQVFP